MIGFVTTDEADSLCVQEKGSKAKLCLQAEDDAQLMQLEGDAMKEGKLQPRSKLCYPR